MSKTKKTFEPGPLRVLILEDNPADAELVEHQLRRAKITFTSLIVEGKRAFSKALADFQPQVILSDFKLPEFDGQAALAVARLQAPDIPFIFVSGSIGEEKAIDLLSQGASDYIFKDNLQRLGPAVRRVIENSRLRREKRMTDEELQRHAEELRILSEAADRFVHINDLDEIYGYLSGVIRNISGADYLLLSLYNEERQGLQPKVLEGIAPFQELLLRKLGRAPEETILLLKDMSPAEFADFVSRKLLPIHAGLFTLTDRTTPRSVCRVIEKTMGITALYSMGFSWENQLFGGLALAFKKGKELRNIPTIEALANLAAVAIKRLLAEKSLRESKDHLLQSEEYYRTLVKTSPDAIIIVDAGGRVTFCSDKTMDIFGIPPGTDIVGVSIFTFVEPAEVSRVQERMIEILSGRSLPEIREYRLQRQDRRPFWGEVSSAPLHDGKGRDIGLLLVCRDISERKRAEAALSESEQRYRLIADNTAETITVLDRDLRFTYISPSIFKLRGFTIEEALKQTLEESLTRDSLARIRDVFQEEMALEMSGTADPKRNRSLELQEFRKDGSIVWVENSLSFLRDSQGKPIGFLAVSKDISERKAAEEQVRASLKEKEVLLQEIHHRVKNNLQIISGLLTLQADQAAGRPLAEIFRESQGRIRSIALIHEKLYRSHNLAEIAFDEYLRALTENLFISHSVASGRIAAKFEMEPMLLSIEKAIPLGLIVNELVTNALKHAFPDGRTGEIRIGLRFSKEARFVGVKTESGTLYRSSLCELTIADDGIGMPTDLASEKEGKLGMKLVSMLSQQLQAELKVNTGDGTEFLLRFPGLPGSDKSHGA